MAGLSAKILLKLQTEEFNKGVQSVKKSIAGLKSSLANLAGALGIGLGFARLGSSLKDTATKLSAAQASLQNVSNGFAEYADNLKFLQRISDDYGQDLLVLTNEFAKFRASAKNSNLTLDEQRDIYESLTRASGAFHLSAEQTSNVMLAVTQMISKGKITSEELRKQLSNTLPGAFNLMAKAAQMAGLTTNGTTAELEKLMKSGKIATDDVLPAFGKALDAATSNASFDSLQSSLNRFSNAWYNFVNTSDSGKFFKNLTDTGVNALNYLTDHFNSFASTVISILAGVFAFKPANKGIKFVNKASAEAIAELSSEAANANKEFEKLDSEYAALSKKWLKNIDEMEKAEEEMNKLFSKNKNYDSYKGKKKEKFEKKSLEIEKKINSLFDERDELENNLHDTEAKLEDLLSKKIITQEQYNAALANEHKITQKLALANTKLGKTISKTWAAFKTMLPALAISAAIALITKLISKIVQYRKEQKELNEYIDNQVNSVNKLSDATIKDIAKAERLKKEYVEIAKSGKTDKETLDKKQKALDKINKQIGLSKSNYLKVADSIDVVVGKIDDYIAAIKKLAKASAAYSKIEELLGKNLELEMKNNELKPKARETTISGQIPSPFNIAGTEEYTRKPTVEASKAMKEIDKNTDQIKRNNEAIERIEKIIKDEGLVDPFSGEEVGGGGGGEDGAVSDKVSRIVENALKEREKLVKRIVNSSSDDEKKTLTEELSKFGDKFEKSLRGLTDKQKNEARKSLNEKVNEAIENDDNDSVERFYDNFNKRVEDAYDIIHDYYKDASEIEKAKYPDKYSNPLEGYGNTKVDDLNEEYDFKKEYLDRLKEEKDRLEELKKKYGNLAEYSNDRLEEVEFELMNLGNEVDSLKRKAEIAQWVADVKELKKEVNSGIYESVKSVAGSVDNLYYSIKSLKELMNDDEATGFEKVLGVINALISALDTLNGTYETIKKTQETIDLLQKATSRSRLEYVGSEIGANLTLAGTNEAIAATEKAIGDEAIRNAGKVVSAKAAEASASEMVASASAKEAVAGVAASNAKIPIVGLALALAGAAAIAALLKSKMQTFSNGGIVGGSKAEHPVMAHNGELILNEAQQRALSGKGGQVEFKLRGSELIGCIDNYNRVHQKR